MENLKLIIETIFLIILIVVVILMIPDRIRYHKMFGYTLFAFMVDFQILCVVVYRVSIVVSWGLTLGLI